LQIGCLPYFYTWCGLSANLECRSEMCCTRLAGNAGPKKIAKNWPSGHHRTICRAISSQLRQLSTIGKKPTCPYNMVNFGPLAPEIVSLVWGTPANFNGFRVLAALLHGSQVVSGRQPNFAALNRGRHLCSAGRPSRWALAHILVIIILGEGHQQKAACLKVKLSKIKMVATASR